MPSSDNGEKDEASPCTEDDNINNDNEDKASLKEYQEARSFLRERFLRVMTSLTKKRGNFVMYENTQVQAEFSGCDVDILHIFVKDLNTPLGTQPAALLRSTDIITMNFKV